METKLNILILYVFDTQFHAVDCYTASAERSRAIEIADEINRGLRTPAQGFQHGHVIDADFWIKKADDQNHTLIPNEWMSCVICWIIH